MGEQLLVALALMLMFEGLLPFISPARWRAAFRQLSELTDGQIRFFGLLALTAGWVLFVVVR